jgi:DNA-directed RNA polymerase subunit RPC12/RpoP
MRYFCEKCGAEYELTDEHIGSLVECQCGHKFQVASPAPPVAKLTSDAAVNPKLMECPDCGAMVSRKALSCPKCGCPFQTAPDSSIPPAQHDKPIRVDTGENVLNRNRGCADLIIYGPLLAIIIFLAFLAIKGCGM